MFLADCEVCYMTSPLAYRDVSIMADEECSVASVAFTCFHCSSVNVAPVTPAGLHFFRAIGLRVTTVPGYGTLSVSSRDRL